MVTDVVSAFLWISPSFSVAAFFYYTENIIYK